MKKQYYVFSIIIMTGLLLTACQLVSQGDTPEPEGDFVYGENAVVEMLDVLLLESFPVQAKVIVSGYYPDGCTELEEISVNQDGQEFILTLTTRRPAGDIACTEALVPFEESIDLDIVGLAAGTYKVIAQNQEVSFKLDADNVLSDPIDESDFTLGTNATVEAMSLNVMESFPVQVNVVLEGYLPDGCTEIHQIESSLKNDAFSIEIITRRPAGDVFCTQAIVPFEEVHSLDVKGLPAGEYIVRSGEISETFTLDTDN